MGEQGRLLGIDYGRVRIGIAVSDALGINATPLGFIRRQSDKQVATMVAALAAKEQVAGLIIGMPINADGTYGGNARWVQQFRTVLAGLTKLPITLVDERYSSSEAKQELRLIGKWPCDPGWVDAQAAAIVLRRHLDGER